MKKLVRVENGSMLGGVCTGIAQYYGEDVAWIRLLAVILLFMNVGFLAYIVAWIVIPHEDAQ